MKNMERTLVVAGIIAMFVMILILDKNIEDLEDRLQKLEQIEDIKINKQNIEGAKQEEQAREIISRGYGIGVSIGGDMSHYLDSLPMDAHVSHGGNDRISTTSKVGAIGGYGGFGRSRIDPPTGDWDPNKSKSIGITFGKEYLKIPMSYTHTSDPLPHSNSFR